MSNNGAPEEKRAKIAEKEEMSPEATEDDALYQAALEEIDDCQSQIDSLNEQASEEILAVEVRFNTLRKPHYSKRAEIIAKVPRFWITAVISPHFNHSCVHLYTMVNIRLIIFCSRYILMIVVFIISVYESSSTVPEYS